MSSGNGNGKRPSVQGGEIQPAEAERAHAEEDDQTAETYSFWSGRTDEQQPNVHTRLLGNGTWESSGGDENASIRPTSPRQGSVMSYNTFRTDLSEDGFGGPYPGGVGSGVNDAADAAHGILGDTIADGLLGGGDGNKMSTTNYLAKRHDIRARRKMYGRFFLICGKERVSMY